MEIMPILFSILYHEWYSGELVGWWNSETVRQWDSGTMAHCAGRVHRVQRVHKVQRVAVSPYRAMIINAACGGRRCVLSFPLDLSL